MPTQSSLQHSEIPLRDFDRGLVWIEPAGKPRRSTIQLQFQVAGLHLFTFSPEEAYTIGASLIEHAKECGYDEDTGDTGEV